ncbi:TPA: DNA-protecting protein DprA [Providencia stuartii]|uniref:DNA-processing protein DprA n=1 Tax=Providencia TaxID=586 RepID=UPI0012392367|nr:MULTISPECIES: DNA-processing protein DprA [Providencia]QET96902.1 DNA-processing protein DprA [Providencia stuartii]HEM8142356.1 DNA-protecting protein DprA [Providencia stuartii]HEM8873472.1 DNA-protecting protein DprA [Providencia stuartii]
MDKLVNNQLEYWKNETVAFLALTSIKGVSYWTLRKIAESQIGFKRLLKDETALKLKSFLRTGGILDKDWAEYQQLLWERGLNKARDLSKRGVSLIFNGQSSFPEKLKNIPDPPYWIFVQGNANTLNAKSVAIVGSREPTDDGIFLSKLVLASLAKENICTVSGLASGIDQIAHMESIRYGLPTIAILGNGIFREYPKGSNKLKENIISSGGAILTEYLPEQNYSAENFIRRNRLQAALCETLIPVQWKIKSGTAHTVEYAYKYKKNIINVYLPYTESYRPELDFAKKNRAAINVEVPKELNRLLDLIINGSSNNSIEPEQQSLNL